MKGLGCFISRLQYNQQSRACGLLLTSFTLSTAFVANILDKTDPVILIEMLVCSGRGVRGERGCMRGGGVCCLLTTAELLLLPYISYE